MLLRKLILLAVCFWTPLLLFVVLAGKVTGGQPIGLDGQIMQTVHSWATPTLDAWAVALTQTGSALAVVAATIGAALMLRRQLAWAGFLLFSVGGAAVVNLVLKLLFQRARPTAWETLVTEHSYSFPSGHAMGSSALALGLVVVAWGTRWRWPVAAGAAVYIGLVGLSRVYLGVHFPTDVVAGWCISLAWVIAVYAVFRRHKR